MCGVLGIIDNMPVNQLLYDSLQLLQHRGQDAAGIFTSDGKRFYSHKDNGLISTVFRTRNMRDLIGNAGIAHVRYPTSGKKDVIEEAQPFYVNSPFGIAFVHNGNLTNTKNLFDKVISKDLRHINTSSDSEVLLNIFAHQLELNISNSTLNIEDIFNAVNSLHNIVAGGYAAIAMIAGYGILAFRDPHGIRPLILGSLTKGNFKSYMIASESVAFNSAGYKIERDVLPGEAIFIDFQGNFYHQQYQDKSFSLNPCMFEYIYFARPDSVIDNISVYQLRLNMGIILAKKISRLMDINDIDVVMPVPDTSRPIALELARCLNKPYREGLIKNRYIGRTFIMPGQEIRKKSVRKKLSPIPCEFNQKNILLVDDSIVRGTTSREIVDMARLSGAKKVFMASAAPEVRFPNLYGIDMPTNEELIAYQRSVEEISNEIGADFLIFQDLDELTSLIKSMNPKIKDLEASCFTGKYITEKEYKLN